MLFKWVVNGLAIAIAGVWVAAVVMTFLDPNYRLPPTVQAIMSILAGAAFAKAAIDASGDD